MLANLSNVRGKLRPNSLRLALFSPSQLDSSTHTRVGTRDVPSVLGNLDLSALEALGGIDEIDERSADLLPGRR